MEVVLFCLVDWLVKVKSSVSEVMLWSKSKKRKNSYRLSFHYICHWSEATSIFKVLLFGKSINAHHYFRFHPLFFSFFLHLSVFMFLLAFITIFFFFFLDKIDSLLRINFLKKNALSKIHFSEGLRKFKNTFIVNFFL